MGTWVEYSTMRFESVFKGAMTKHCFHLASKAQLNAWIRDTMHLLICGRLLRSPFIKSAAVFDLRCLPWSWGT
jgi:hypothetical protein